MKDMVAAGNLSSESQHDGDDVGGGGGVDDMRSDPYRPRSLARFIPDENRRTCSACPIQRARCLPIPPPSSDERANGRTEGRTLGGVSQRAPFSLFFGWRRGKTTEACANYTTGF